MNKSSHPDNRLGPAASDLPSSTTMWAALEVSPDPVIFFSVPDLRVVATNPAALHKTAFTHDEIRTLHLVDLFPDARTGVLATRVKSLVREGSGDFSINGVICGKRTERLPTLILLHATADGIIAIARELTDGQHFAQLANFDVHRDALTGLQNRRFLEHRLTHTHSKSYGIVFIDIDGFKAVNDRFGHLAGDQVLAACAKRLQACARPSDVVARFGGDEFVVLAEGIRRSQDLSNIALRIADSLSISAGVGDDRISLTASVGIAVSPSGPACCPKRILAEADRSMYHMKTLDRSVSPKHKQYQLELNLSAQPNNAHNPNNGESDWFPANAATAAVSHETD